MESFLKQLNAIMINTPLWLGWIGMVLALIFIPILLVVAWRIFRQGGRKGARAMLLLALMLLVNAYQDREEYREMFFGPADTTEAAQISANGLRHVPDEIPQSVWVYSDLVMKKVLRVSPAVIRQEGTVQHSMFTPRGRDAFLAYAATERLDPYVRTSFTVRKARTLMAADGHKEWQVFIRVEIFPEDADESVTRDIMMHLIAAPEGASAFTPFLIDDWQAWTEMP